VALDVESRPTSSTSTVPSSASVSSVVRNLSVHLPRFVYGEKLREAGMVGESDAKASHRVVDARSRPR